MPDHLLIYLIVVLNSLCHVMLIWRQKLEPNTKWKFCGLAVATPVLIMLIMRLLIASGTIHGVVAEQSFAEQFLTKGTSMLLIAAPWFVTFAAIMVKMKNSDLLKKQVVS